MFSAPVLQTQTIDAFGVACGTQTPSASDNVTLFLAVGAAAPTAVGSFTPDSDVVVPNVAPNVYDAFWRGADGIDGAHGTWMVTMPASDPEPVTPEPDTPTPPIVTPAIPASTSAEITLTCDVSKFGVPLHGIVPAQGILLTATIEQMPVLFNDPNTALNKEFFHSESVVSEESNVGGLVFLPLPRSSAMRSLAVGCESLPVTYLISLKTPGTSVKPGKTLFEKSGLYLPDFDTISLVTLLRLPVNNGGIVVPLPPPAFSADVAILVANTDLSGHRAVLSENGQALYADSLSPAHAGRVVGVTTGAASQGTDVQVQSAGELQDDSFAFLPGAIWLGPNGALTQIVPAQGFAQQLGVALSPTRLLIELGAPILL